MIPEEFVSEIKPGVRVRVQFGGRNLYAGIVSNVHDIPPLIKNVKPVIEILDTIPVVNEKLLKLWHWISDYYLCSEGEVLKAALPSELSISTYKPRLETFIELAARFTEDELNVILDKLNKAPRQFSLLAEYLKTY